MPYKEPKYEHLRKLPPEEFDPRSFRTIEIKPGVKGVVACPKGEWDPKAPTGRQCKVGMKLQKIEKKKE